MTDGSRSRGGRAALRNALLLISVTCLAAALAGGVRAGWMQAKSVVAQRLLERAWTTAPALPGRYERPWAWADIGAAARLEVPALDIALIVLADASGEALAFGPGLVAGDPLRAERSTLVLGGHRDTHLAFLAEVPAGTELRLTAADGRTHRYRTGPGRVLDVRRETLAIADDAPGLVLVTCFPFDATHAGGPLRWAVAARRIEPVAVPHPDHRRG